MSRCTVPGRRTTCVHHRRGSGIVDSFIASARAKTPKAVVERLSRDAFERVLAYPWPGNVRELEHAIERAVLMAGGPMVAPGDLGLRRSQDGAQSLENMGLEDVEAFLIRKAVSRYGSVTEAAKALGLSRSALYRRLERYGIEP